MSEHDEQAAVVKWFELQYPNKSKLLMAYISSGIFGGGKRMFGLINKFKKEGWRKGVPDLFLAMPNGGYYGLFIEMKDKDKNEKSLSDEQVEYLNLLGEHGYKTVWCAGFDEAKKQIEEYMK